MLTVIRTGQAKSFNFYNHFVSKIWRFCCDVPASVPRHVFFFWRMRYTWWRLNFEPGGTDMKLLLILGVCFAFLSAIFTGGYEDKPGTAKDNKASQS
jgi:hypothetical protein